jgi:hypothetical protein
VYMSGSGDVGNVSNGLIVSAMIYWIPVPDARLCSDGRRLRGMNMNLSRPRCHHGTGDPDSGEIESEGESARRERMERTVVCLRKSEKWQT